VVEGMLNGDGTAEIFLTRTQRIYDETPPPPVTGAYVEIQDDQNNAYPLFGNFTGGRYRAENIPTVPGRRYRLYIRTDKEYLSDFTELKITPPIDSISYRLGPFGLNINVNTHDPSRESRFYKWQYDETWEYNARNFSSHRLIEGVLFEKHPSEWTYRCYGYQPQGPIAVGTTSRLAEDRISEFTLVTIPEASSKLYLRYSIRVRQYAITEQAYNYWLNLKKNTEQVGGLFDPLPSEVKGNIICISDPSQKAIGFFSASTVTEQRIFIVATDLPEGYRKFRPSPCSADTTLFDPMIMYGSAENVLGPIYGDGPNPIGFTSAPTPCMDCRSEGGTLTKPDYWN